MCNSVKLPLNPYQVHYPNKRYYITYLKLKVMNILSMSKNIIIHTVHIYSKLSLSIPFFKKCILYSDSQNNLLRH